MPTTNQASQELSKLTQKRLALESLIRITASIQIQQKSLLELSAISKPSQDFPPKLITQIKLLTSKIGELPIPELITRLDKVEAVMAKNLKSVLMLAEVDANQLRDEELENLSIDEFIDAINNFKRRTQIAVALRYILKKRGIAIAPYTLSIPQESIVEHIDSLRKKEQSCVKKIRKEIVGIIKDSQVMIAMDGLTEKMRNELVDVKEAMQINLNHLDSGGNVKDIPNVFETIVLESKSNFTTAQDTDKETQKTEVQQITSKENSDNELEFANPKKESFWSLFKKWLSSPWSVSWKNIKQNSSDKEQK